MDNTPSADIRAEADRVFAQIDKDKSNLIDVLELQSALALGHINLSLHTSQALMRLFRTSPGRVATSEIKLDRQDFAKLHAFMLDIVNVFKLFDGTDTGKLSRDEVQAALENINYPLSTAAFDALFRACDPDQNNHLNLEEWVVLAVALRGARATFRAFVPPNMQNAPNPTINLTEDQFVFALAHIM